MVAENTMKQTEIGLIPEEWEVVKMAQIAGIVGGGTPSTFISAFWNGNIPWFTPTEVGFSKYLYSSKRKISDLGFKKSSANLLPVNSILLTTRAGIGDLGILKIEACTNQGFQSIVCIEGVDYEFVYYLMSTKKAELLKNASGSTFLEISPNRIKGLLIPLPPLTEQEAIATALSDCDAWIESLEKVIVKKRFIKQGAMQELLTPKEDWEVKRLGEIGEFLPTNSLSRDKLNYVSGEIYNIHYGDIHTRYKSLFKIEREFVPFINPEVKYSNSIFLCKKGDLIIADASENEADIGKAIEIGGLNFNKVVSGLHTVHFRPVGDLFAYGFINYLWQSFDIKTQVLKEAQGTKVLGISTTRLRDIQIAFPSLSEQSRITTILSDMDTEIDALSEKLSKARLVKQGMMQQLLTGKVRLI